MADHPRYLYDADADALYMQATSHPVARTEVLDGLGIAVDYDADGAAVGIELLNPGRFAFFPSLAPALTSSGVTVHITDVTQGRPTRINEGGDY